MALDKSPLLILFMLMRTTGSYFTISHSTCTCTYARISGIALTQYHAMGCYMYEVTLVKWICQMTTYLSCHFRQIQLIDTSINMHMRNSYFTKCHSASTIIIIRYCTKPAEVGFCYELSQWSGFVKWQQCWVVILDKFNSLVHL